MPHKILIVDDEPATVRVLSVILEMNHYETISAYSGTEAYECLQAGLPDAMLLDIMLPDISGLELCRRLREDEATSNLLIIMITAHAEPNIRERGLEAGADHVWLKPISLEKLTKDLRDIVHEHRVSPS